MNQKYRKREFVMFPVGNGFIVLNTKKKFDEGHSHIKKFKNGRVLISLAIKKKLPKNPYFADSLIRISKDIEYIKKLEDLKESIMTHKDFEKMMKDVVDIDASKCQ